MRKLTQSGGLLLAFVLLATTIVYLQGLSGPFLFDDGPNLLYNRFMHLETLEGSALKDAALANESGLFRRPISSISFALNYFFAGGFKPFAFKLVNLVIHLLNGILLFLLVKRLVPRLMPGEPENSTGIALMPVIVAAWWLLHPLQLTSVLYVVQRMTSLSAFFVLGGLLVFTIGRARLERGAAAGFTLMGAGVIGGGTLGLLCKENAALIPLYALVIEYCCFSRSDIGDSLRIKLRLFYWAVAGVPLLLVLAYAALRPEFILSGYLGRSFTPTERLLTQPRVLFFYLGLLVFPSRHVLGLYHDDFTLSRGLLDPLSTFVALAAWIALVIVALKYRRKVPILFFALTWYLAGHAMESTILPLEMVFEHRNYVPSIGPILFLTLGVWMGLKRISGRDRLAYTAMAIVTLTLAFVTHSRAYTWSDIHVLLESMVRHHPEAARTHGYYAEVLINARANPQKAFYHLQQYSRLSPGSINGLAEMLRLVKSAELNAHPSAVPADEALSLFDAPLTNDSAALSRLERLLLGEIERRIQSQPVSGSTVKTIADLQACLYEGASICVELAPKLARWSELALANPSIISIHRAILLLASAKIQTWHGNVEKGKAYAKLAVETAPQEVHFLIELARLHLALEEYRRGLDVVDRIKEQGSRFGFRMSEVAALEAELRSRLADQKAGGVTSSDRRVVIQDRL